MSLVTFPTSPQTGGTPDIIGLSRLESGGYSLNRGPRASNEAPVDKRGDISVEMPAESVVCAMEWLDIALDEIEEESPKMDERIVDVKPRDSPGMTTVPSNPDDIRECVELILHWPSRCLWYTEDDLGLV